MKVRIICYDESCELVLHNEATKRQLTIEWESASHIGYSAVDEKNVATEGFDEAPLTWGKFRELLQWIDESPADTDLRHKRTDAQLDHFSDVIKAIDAIKRA